MSQKNNFNVISIFKHSVLWLGIALLTPDLFAVVPPAEKLLPPDTLVLISAPDWSKLREIYKKSPQSQFWNDPSMKAFREKFVAKWEEEFTKPLERDLGVKFDDYSALLQGQFTLAILQEDWQGKAKDDGEPAFLFLIDTKEKSDLLKKNLATLRKKWSDAGKSIKTERIRDVEFSIVQLTTNDVPKTLRQFFPQYQDVEELGKEDEKKKSTSELVIGQHDSLLIIGSTVKAVEKVMARFSGNSATTLADQADFEANRLALFRDAPLFGWINARTFVDVGTKALANAENPEAPSPLQIPGVGKMISASGLSGLKTIAFNFRDTGDGRMVELFLSAPESGRKGLLQLLALDSKESNMPAFIPGDALKYSRFRFDCQKAISTLEKMVGEISPEALGAWNYVLNNGNEAVRQTDPDYDIRKNIFGNLGDDLIMYEKAPRGKTAAELASAPSLFLLGSPNPEKLAASLKGLFVIATPSGGAPKTREFLGKKIYSFKMPGMTSPLGGSSGSSLSYAASGGYVAFSTDESILEEYLRSSESGVKPLRETAGLADAIAKVGGQNTGWLIYENESESMRRVLELLHLSANSTNRNETARVLESAFPFASPEKKFKDWLDFSLLPAYDKVSKYFGFSVYSGSTTVGGITVRYFAPTPAQLKK